MKKFLLGLLFSVLAGTASAQTASTYYTAPTVAAVKALTTRPAVIEIVDANPGVFNWGTTPCSAADDIFQITPTSGPTGCYTRMAGSYALGKSATLSGLWTTNGSGIATATTTLPAGILTTATGASQAATFPARFSRILNVVDDFGADRTGATSSTAALNAAYTALAATGGLIRFPAGTYRFDTAPTAILKSGTYIQCDGQTNTVLSVNYTTGDFLKFGSNAGSIDYVGMSDCTISTPVVRVSGAYINIDGAGRNIFENLRLVGAFDGINIDSYGNQTETRISNVIGESFVAGGRGIVFGQNSTSPNVVNGVYVDKTIFASVPTAFDFYYADGIVMERVQSYLATNAVVFRPPSGKTVSNTSFAQSFLDSSTGSGVLFSNGGGATGDITFTAGTAINSNGTTTSHAGIEVAASAIVSGIKVNGSYIVLNKGPGISLAAGTDISITDNEITFNSQASSGSKPGIDIAANMVKFNIIGNLIGAGGFQGLSQSNSQNYPVLIAVGTSDNYIIQNNRCQGNTTSNAVSDGGTGTSKIVLNGCAGTVTPTGAAAGTLTGTTLASNVVTSSLTSVGAITSGTWNAGTVQSSSTIIAITQFLGVNGSAGTPVYSNGGATNLGMYFPGGNSLGFTVGGSLKATIDSSGLAVSGTFQMTQASPASGAACTAGQIAADTNYLYTCASSGAWKRVAMTGGY